LKYGLCVPMKFSCLEEIKRIQKEKEEWDEVHFDQAYFGQSKVAVCIGVINFTDNHLNQGGLS